MTEETTRKESSGRSACGASRQRTRWNTEKLAGLFLKLLRFVSRPGDLVLDCFAGMARWAREAVARGWNIVLIEREQRWAGATHNDWPLAGAEGQDRSFMP